MVETLSGRLGVADVSDLLETEGVRKVFGFSPADLERLRHWFDETNIRWGEDAGHRRELGVGSFPENSWRAGLDRLLLGYAMSDEGVFRGVSPLDAIEGGRAASLARFMHFWEKVRHYRGKLRLDRPLARWGALFSDMVRDFLDPGDDGIPLYAAFARLGTLEGFDGDVTLQTVMDQVERGLGGHDFGHNLFTGAVNFCALREMQGPPFRVVCLLGMNEGFPASEGVPSFSLLKGGHTARDEDRRMFYDAVLSARETLIVTFTGRSMHDGGDMPPSPLVRELIESVRTSTGVSAKIRLHPLRSHDPLYFDENPDFFSYSASAHGACLGLAGPKVPRTSVVPELPPPDSGFLETSVERFLSFFRNPCRFLLRERLGVVLRSERSSNDDEPAELDSLQDYLLLLRLSDFPSESHASQAARGNLPPGRLGRAVFLRKKREISFFLDLVRRRLSDALEYESLPVSARAGGVSLHGSVPFLPGAGVVLLRPTKIKPKDRLRARIVRLLTDTKVTAVGWDSKARDLDVFEPETGEGLEDLAALYVEGLSRPLPFLPDISWAVLEALRKDASLEEACALLAEDFRSDRSKWPREMEDMHEGYFHLCFRTGERDRFLWTDGELFGRFVEITKRIWI